MKKYSLFLYVAVFLMLGVSFAAAGTTTLSTYYPAPDGNYNHLTANNVGIGTTISPSAALVVMGGNVSIGTTTPTAALDVIGIGVGDLRVRHDGGTINASAPYISFYGGTGSGATTRIGYFGKTNQTSGDMEWHNAISGGNINLTTNSGNVSILPSGGNVGIGVTNPGAQIDMVGSAGIRLFNNVGSAASVSLDGAANGSPSVQFKQSGSLVGQIEYLNADGTMEINGGGGSGQLVVKSSGNVGIGVTGPVNKLDVNGSMAVGSYAGNNTGPSNGLIVSGNVGIGITLPNGTLDIKSGTNHDVGFQDDSGYGTVEIVGRNDALARSTLEINGVPLLLNVRGSGNVGIGNASPTQQLTVTGNILASGTITASSDRRLKQNIKPLTGTLSRLDQLRGVSFEWNHLATSMRHKEGEKGIGMIAQELQKVYPELVVGSKKDYLSIDYGEFTAVLLQVAKDQQKEIKDQGKEIHALKEGIRDLKTVLCRKLKLNEFCQ